MNLLRAELQRLIARRFVRLLLALLVGACVLTIGTTVATSHQPTAAELRQAERQAAESLIAEQRWYEQCLAAQVPGAPTPNRFGPGCTPPNPEYHRAEVYLNGVFVFARQATPLLLFLTAFLALFGFLVGASFVGAELASGGLTNLLLWRPQRGAVLAAKLGTLLGGVLALSVTCLVLYLGAFWAIAEIGGLMGAVGGEFALDLLATSARAVAVTLATTAAGFALATIGRHTAAALGVVAAYLVVWELGARLMLEIVEANRPERLMLTSYVAAWMAGEMTFWERYGCGVSATDCSPQWFITAGHAAIVLGSLVALLVGAAFALFRRRDLA